MGHQINFERQTLSHALRKKAKETEEEQEQKEWNLYYHVEYFVNEKKHRKFRIIGLGSGWGDGNVASSIVRVFISGAFFGFVVEAFVLAKAGLFFCFLR